MRVFEQTECQLLMSNGIQEITKYGQAKKACATCAREDLHPHRHPHQHPHRQPHQHPHRRRQKYLTLAHSMTRVRQRPQCVHVVVNVH